MTPREVRNEWIAAHPDVVSELLTLGLAVEAIEDTVRYRIILDDIVRFSRAWRKNGDRDDLWDVIAEAENVLSGAW